MQPIPPNSTIDWPALPFEAWESSCDTLHSKLGEFLLKYEDVRTAPSPDQAILDFSESTYEAGAKLAHWDREALERNPTPA